MSFQFLIIENKVRLSGLAMVKVFLNRLIQVIENWAELFNSPGYQRENRADFVLLVYTHFECINDCTAP